MNHLDLFSGIGGFALAAQWCWGKNHKVTAFCEIDPFCQLVLKKHFPGVGICENIKDIHAENRRGQIDLLTGGFPCQPASTAGKRRGTSDDRWLWPEMYRIIRECRPCWVIAENVPGLLTLESGVVFSNCIADLEREGYEVQPFVIPACGVGAPHRRDRVWIVAHYDSSLPVRAKHEVRSGRNAVDAGGEDALHTQILGLGTRQPEPEGLIRETGFGGSGDWSEPWPAVAARLCRVDDGLPGGVDGTGTRRKTKTSRRDRLKALGNAIVPQVAYEIMLAIKHVEESH